MSLYVSANIKAVLPNGDLIGNCMVEGASYDGWSDFANAVATHEVTGDDLYEAIQNAETELEEKLRKLNVYDCEIQTIEYDQPEIEDEEDDDGDSIEISCSATVVIIPDED